MDRGIVSLTALLLLQAAPLYSWRLPSGELADSKQADKHKEDKTANVDTTSIEEHLTPRYGFLPTPNIASPLLNTITLPQIYPQPYKDPVKLFPVVRPSGPIVNYDYDLDYDWPQHKRRRKIKILDDGAIWTKYPNKKHLIEIVPIKHKTKKGKALAYILPKSHSMKKKLKKEKRIAGIVFNRNMKDLESSEESSLIDSNDSDSYSIETESSEEYSNNRLIEKGEKITESQAYDDNHVEDSINNKLNNIVSYFKGHKDANIDNLIADVLPDDEADPEYHVHYIIHKKRRPNNKHNTQEDLINHNTHNDNLIHVYYKPDTQKNSSQHEQVHVYPQSGDHGHHPHHHHHWNDKGSEENDHHHHNDGNDKENNESEHHQHHHGNDDPHHHENDKESNENDGDDQDHHHEDDIHHHHHDHHHGNDQASQENNDAQYHEDYETSEVNIDHHHHGNDKESNEDDEDDQDHHGQDEGSGENYIHHHHHHHHDDDKESQEDEPNEIFDLEVHAANTIHHHHHHHDPQHNTIHTIHESDTTPHYIQSSEETGYINDDDISMDNTKELIHENDPELYEIIAELEKDPNFVLDHNDAHTPYHIDLYNSGDIDNDSEDDLSNESDIDISDEDSTESASEPHDISISSSSSEPDEDSSEENPENDSNYSDSTIHFDNSKEQFIKEDTSEEVEASGSDEAEVNLDDLTKHDFIFKNCLKLQKKKNNGKCNDDCGHKSYTLTFLFNR